MQEIQLKLTLAEVNQILEALGNKPYAEVFELVAKLQQQAQSQLCEQEGQPATASSESEA